MIPVTVLEGAHGSGALRHHAIVSPVTALLVATRPAGSAVRPRAGGRSPGKIGRQRGRRNAAGVGGCAY